MANISTLLFDFGGTLDEPGGHWLDRFNAQYARAGLELSRTQLDAAYSHATAKAYRAAGELRQCGLEQLLDFLIREQFSFLATQGPPRVRTLLDRAGEREREALARQISAGFAGQSRRGLERSRQTLESLAPRYRLGVVSNFYGNLDRVLEEAGLFGMMAVIVDSVQVGAFKPELKIFETALAILGEPATQVAMVGDSLEKDLAPAHRLGLKTVWLCGPHAARTEIPAGLVTYTIGSLDELAGLAW